VPFSTSLSGMRMIIMVTRPCKANLNMANSVRIDEQRQKRDSLSISIVVHLLLLLLLIIPIISAVQKQPDPPQFQGIKIALGNVDAEHRTKSKAAPAASLSTESTSKPQPQTNTSASKQQSSKPAKASLIKLVSETITKKESPIVAVEEKLEDKSKEQERKEKLDKEAKAKAEAQAEAKAEAAKLEAAKKAAARKAAQKAAKNKFNNLMTSANGDGEPSKGTPDGKPDAAALEGITTGTGKAGNGLGDRAVLFAPQISDNTQLTGKVVVNICVNGTGKVVKSTFTQKGSTTTDSHLIGLAIKSAKKYVFSESSLSEQCGDITIDFKLR